MKRFLLLVSSAPTPLNIHQLKVPHMKIGVGGIEASCERHDPLTFFIHFSAAAFVVASKNAFFLKQNNS